MDGDSEGEGCTCLPTAPEQPALVGATEQVAGQTANMAEALCIQVHVFPAMICGQVLQ